MLHLFLGLKSLVKVSRYHTDGSVFRLHYRVTVMALLAFTFIVTTRQYIGAPIMCVHTKEIPKDVLNTYCWIHPTYTLSSAHWKRVGVDVPHPGVDKTRDDRDKKHVKYYQWVGFCLFFQVRIITDVWFRENKFTKKKTWYVKLLILYRSIFLFYFLRHNFFILIQIFIWKSFCWKLSISFPKNIQNL